MAGEETYEIIKNKGVQLLHPDVRRFKELLMPSLQSCIDLLDILKDGKWHTAKNLSAKCDLNANTVNTYLRALQDAGIGLVSKTGKGWLLPSQLRQPVVDHFSKR